MQDYFKWLTNYIRGGPYDVGQYKMLLQNLFMTNYYFNNKSDENRAIDGLALRKKYYEKLISDPVDIKSYMGGQCSLLEMMIAFCIRIEEEYLNDFKYGDRTQEWFWDMIKALKLDHMTNDKFDEDEFKDHVNNFMVRSVAKDGYPKQLTLFESKKRPIPMDKYPIWDQMISWTNDKLMGLI